MLLAFDECSDGICLGSQFESMTEELKEIRMSLANDVDDFYHGHQNVPTSREIFT
jgi:hypothetical protein